jgi:hypothetical protein
MESAVASFKKTNGHKVEERFAELIGGSVLKGHGKADVAKDEESFSVKGEVKNIQWCLYGENGILSTEKCSSFNKPILNILSGSKEKEHIGNNMKSLLETLKEKENLKSFLNVVMLGNKTGKMAFLDNDEFKVCSGENFVDYICENCEVVSSIARGNYPPQKVIVKHEGTNFLELEIRKDKNNFLCVSHNSSHLNILKKLPYEILKEEA